MAWPTAKTATWLRNTFMEDLAKLVVCIVAIFVAVVVVTLIAKHVPNLDLSLVRGPQWVCVFVVGVLGLLVGFTIALAIGLWSSRFEADEFASQWNQIVQKIEDRLGSAEFGDLWFSRPWEYAEYLKKVDDAFANAHASSRLDTMSLYGTMVGFGFLLPEPIRDHIVEATSDLRNLHLYTSDAVTRLKRDNESEELAPYPLFLVARITDLLVSEDDAFSKWASALKPLQMEIYYMKRDLLGAAIHFPGTEAVVLQALHSELFSQILAGEELQRGFRYANDEKRADAFDRIEAVLENTRTQFSTQALDQPRHESWHFTWVNSEPRLDIKNAHWFVEKNQTATLLRADEYPPAPPKSHCWSDRDSIRANVRILLTALRQRGKISDLESEVERQRKDNWELARNAARTSSRIAAVPASNVLPL